MRRKCLKFAVGLFITIIIYVLSISLLSKVSVDSDPSYHKETSELTGFDFKTEQSEVKSQLIDIAESEPLNKGDKIEKFGSAREKLRKLSHTPQDGGNHEIDQRSDSTESIPEFTCLRPDPPKLLYHLCIFSLKKDWYISASIMKTGQWEGDLSAAILQALKSHPGADFVDLGAYIGSHTIFIAHKGYQVVSVEPYKENLFLLNRSLELNHLLNVRVIPHCISNKTGEETLLKFGNNPGGAKIILKPDHMRRPTSQLKCITLNQLSLQIPFKRAIMKMDIEESEVRVLQEHSAAVFFKQVEIFVIFMEWGSMPKLKNTESEVEVTQMLQFLISRQFEPFVITTSHLRSLMNVEWDTWPWDIVWLKNGRRNHFAKFIDKQQNFKHQVRI